MANRKVANAVRLALVAAGAASAGFGTPVVVAQDTEMEQIVVTGSRIRIRDFEEISPVASVGAAEIASIGALTVDQVLNNLPQVVPGLTATSNNPSDGTATVDLRGLGPTRTLVLINGRRLTPTTQTGRVDLNNVPTQLIERVEVVTGGASAVYGSDALAGVVNFILKDDFEGVEIGTQYGTSDRGDGTEQSVDVTLGGNFADGKGNFTGFASYLQRDEILQADRSYTAVDYGYYHILGLQSATAGSVTGEAGRFDNSAPNPFGAFGGQAARRNWVQEANGTVRRHNSNLAEYNNGVGDRYNFAPVNYLLTPADRWTLGGLGHFEINEHADVYTELLYVNSQNATQLAPTPATNVSVVTTSPFLSADMQALAATRPDPDAPLAFRRRMTELGPRQQENTSNLFQMTTGVKGTVGFKDWEYDAYYLYGRNQFDNYTLNDVSRSRLEAGIAGCPEDYAAFVKSCVPVNPFGLGTISQEAADFVRLNFADSQEFTRGMFSAVINGTAFDLPAGPLGFALGTEIRKDSTQYRPDIAKQQGDILGFNAQQPIEGSIDVTEFFVEAAVPLIKDVVAIQNLSLELGYRFSDYSTVGNIDAYKGGLNWQFNDAFRARGMYQRAVRAPSVFELYQAGDQGFPVYTDPCAGGNVGADPLTAETIAFCQEQGIPDPETFIQNNSQVETFFFGSPELSEETSDTWTFGLVFTPTSVQGLSASLDFYDIKVDDYVNTLNGGVSGIINACFDTLDLTSSDCFFEPLALPLITRNDSGEMKINAPTVNESELRTKGVDLQINYVIPVFNNINVTLLTTYLDSYELDGIEYAGSSGAYNISGSFPEWKANLRVSAPVGPVTLNWQLSYIDSMINQGDIDNGQAFEEGSCGEADGPYEPCFGTIGSKVYNDLSAVWNINDMVSLTAGVNNVFDEEPELIQLGVDMNTDPGTYDVIGRYWFGNLRVKF